MNLLNDQLDQTTATKTQTELVQQEKQEFKLLGTYLRTPGLTLFCYNPKVDQVQEVQIKKSSICKMVIAPGSEKGYDIQPYEPEKIEVDPTWEYFESLNLKSAQNRVQKWKDRKLSTLWNLRIPGKLNSIKLY